MGGIGKIYIQNVRRGSRAFDEREEGCRTAIAATNGAVELVGVGYDEGDAELAKRQTSDILRQTPDLRGVFITAAAGAEGTWQLIQAAGRGDSVAVAAFDAQEAALAALRSGALDIVIAQHPFEMGQKCIETAAKYLKGQDNIPPHVVTGFTIVTSANIDSKEVLQAIYGPAEKQ